MLRVLILLALSLWMTTGALAEKRVALVIGNGAYQNAVALPNPPNDATDIAKKLTELDFTVIVGVDQTRDDLEASLRKFAQEARDATMTLFFYSGHGIQVDGHNYIIPIDAKLEDVTALDFETIDADRVFAYMGGDGRIALAFLDACRDNPLSRRFARALPKSRSNAVGVGLAMPQTVGTGLFIGFSTAPGDVALDGDGRNSPFTTALLNHIAEPGLEINGVMTRVKSEVQAATNGDQRPWTNSDLSTEVFLKRAVVVEQATTPDPVKPEPKPEPDQTAGGEDTTRGGGTTTGVDPEQFMYAAAERANTEGAWQAFIAAFPNSLLKGVAEANLKKLRQDVAVVTPAPTPPVEPPPATTNDETIKQLIADATTAYANRRYEEAVRHYTDAVELGSAIAMGDLAYLTEQGLGTSKSPSRAVELYLDAIAGGNSAAAYNYGWMLERGEGITRDPKEAARRIAFSLAEGEAATRQSILGALIADVGNLSTEARRALQQELKDRGLYTGSIDGSFGPASKAALTRLAEGS